MTVAVRPIELVRTTSEQGAAEALGGNVSFDNVVKIRRDQIFTSTFGRDALQFIANRLCEANDGLTPEDASGLGTILRLMVSNDDL